MSKEYWYPSIVFLSINKFGHCASYQTIQRFETGLAIDYVNRMSNDEVILPSNIFPGSFVQAAADNNDFQEETINGKMTTHATSLVLYQRKIEPNVNQMPNDIPKRVRERSLKDIDKIRPKLLSLSNNSRKPSTTDLFGKVDLQWFVNTDCAAKEEANLLDNAWILLRMCPDYEINCLKLLLTIQTKLCQAGQHLIYL